MKHFSKTLCAVGALSITPMTALADQVILDDLIVDGSACIGFDCVNGESFGFDTLRLKENNLRIRAQDTSASASFPTNDWQITFNDTSNGGANKFSIDDIDNNRTPFTIEATAPSNALYVDSSGRIGFGTSSPTVQAHVVNGNTPTLRLEQDGSSGFTAQTWDMAGNEANFFVRDATNGSTLPFRIQPGAASNLLYLANDEQIGVKTTSPDAELHVVGGALVSDTDNGAAAAAALEVRNNAAAGNQTLALLTNANGRPRLQMDGNGNATQTGSWSMSAGQTFVIQDRTTSTNTMIIDGTGNVTITGTLTEGSDKFNKMAIEPVDTTAILEKVAELPVAYWTYKDDAESGIRHIGPMAQDFYAAFGTGATDRGISTLDSSGVALAAIQALAVENDALKQRLADLESRVSD